MKEYETRVARVCSRLNAEHARYVVVGATAMQLWGTTRATRDVDILTRAWNLRWEQARLHATTFDVEGVPVPTASIDDLIESKQTGRLQDSADIEVLEAIRQLRDE